jgi:hypothetical protein
MLNTKILESLKAHSEHAYAKMAELIDRFLMACKNDTRALFHQILLVNQGSHFPYIILTERRGENRSAAARRENA